MAGLYEKGKRSTSRKGVQKDTRKIADGTLRRGPGGKMNMYDAKTGRWKRAVKSTAAKKRATAASSQPSAKTAVSAAQKRRDASMANRKGLTAASKRKPATTSATVSSAMLTKKGSYQAGTGGGTNYNKAMSVARYKKYGTTGQQVLAGVGKAVTDTFKTRPDSVVNARNKAAAEARRKKQAAAKAAIKKAADARKKSGRW